MHRASAPTCLVDRFGRRVTYARLSVTDRCDLRCLYCMDGEMRFMHRLQLLSLEELARLGRCFSELGVRRLRITGGEPLVRRNVLWLFEQLGSLPGVTDLTLTTNGTQLERFARPLKDAGVTRVNISLDSLRPERFRTITRQGDLARTLAGIAAARAAGFARVKLNTVVMRGCNHDEVTDLVRFALDRDLDISFIEEMPLGESAAHDRAATWYPGDAVRRDLAAHWDLIPSTETTGGPARYFRIRGSASRIGFICPQTHNFCASCNRVRVTAAGRLMLCLGQDDSVDLRRALRAHPGDDAALKRTLVAAMALKPQGHAFAGPGVPQTRRHMNLTGG